MTHYPLPWDESRRFNGRGSAQKKATGRACGLSTPVDGQGQGGIGTQRHSRHRQGGWSVRHQTRAECRLILIRTPATSSRRRWPWTTGQGREPASAVPLPPAAFFRADEGVPVIHVLLDEGPVRRNLLCCRVGGRRGLDGHGAVQLLDVLELQAVEVAQSGNRARALLVEDIDVLIRLRESVQAHAAHGHDRRNQ